MNLWAIVRSLSFRQIWSLFVLCSGNIPKLLPTWKATKKSVSYANKIYGKEHHKNIPANAFRHAVWNYLIAHMCLGKAGNVDEVLLWTKKITDLHEDIFPNDELARKMDLHNNQVGREIFSSNIGKEIIEIVELLKDMTKDSYKINSVSDIDSIPKDRMIHIEENTQSE